MKFGGEWEVSQQTFSYGIGGVSVNIAALFDCAADRFSPCMDAKVDSKMDRLEKRIDEKIDSKTWSCDGQIVGAGENQQLYEKRPLLIV